jgi:hypothetical protein
MLRVYEVWQDDGGRETTFATVESLEDLRTKGLLSPNAQFLYRIEAHSQEEAMAIHHLRMGWEPYVPVGESQACPKCGAQFYPESSGQCWKCGQVS